MYGHIHTHTCNISFNIEYNNLEIQCNSVYILYILKLVLSSPLLLLL